MTAEADSAVGSETRRRADHSLHAAAAPAGIAHRAVSGIRSKIVTALKLALPLIAGTLILIVAVWPQLTQRDDRFRVGTANVGLEEAATLRMVKPRFTGIDSSNRPFVVTADDAVHLPSDNSVVELKAPKADVTLTGGSWVMLSGDAGNYYKELRILDVYGHVNMFHDSGYEFRTQTARFDLANSLASGDDPVDGQGPFGTIAAQGFRVVNRGELIHFLGRTRLVISRGQPAVQQGAAR